MVTTIPLGPATANLTGIRANDRNLMQFTLKSGTAPLDITGFEWSAQARKKPTDPDPAPITAVIEVVDAMAGVIHVRWPGDQVAAVLGYHTTWNGVWDLQYVSGSSDPITVVAGTFNAVMDVTRS